MTMIGRIEDVEFTIGGLGNQWTTIDGKKYATWWDVREFKQPIIGSVVEYEVKLHELVWYSPRAYADTARIIRQVTEKCDGTDNA